MSRRRRWRAVLAATLAGLAGLAMAADIRLNNLDAGTGRGLDDPKPAAPVGGNPGRTRGEQARIVFQYAASLWGAVLKSRVPIEVDASFKPLACTANSGLLGSAGPSDAVFFDTGKEPLGAKARTIYHLALANALAGVDVSSHKADVNANFNGAMGSPGCLEGQEWYFGLDGSESAKQISFLKVVLHELSHGLGFLGFNYLSTGELSTDDKDGTVLSDMYSSYIYDNAMGKGWYGMTNAERKSAALDDGQLVFTGPHVKAHAQLALGRGNFLQITAPAAVAGPFVLYRAPFGPLPSPFNFSGAVVRAATGADAEACAAFDNAAAMAGHVALVDRGGCDYVAKARFAQAAGATGVIVADKEGDNTPVLPGDNSGAQVRIPLIQVSVNDGKLLKSNLTGLQVEVRTQGVDSSGNVQLYAPRALAMLSSVYHFDARVWPVPLMEPNDTHRGRVPFDLDLTPSVFLDEGWQVNAGGQLLGVCDTGVPAWRPGGLIVGANIAATAKMLALASATPGDYTAGIREYAKKLARDGRLSAAQASSLNLCLADAEVARQYQSWRAGGNGGVPFDELDSGKLLTALAGSAGSERLYLLTVPSGARSLNIRSFGGTGDTSLYVKVGNEPSASSNHYRSVHAGNNESVVIARPAPGSYFIKVVGLRPYVSLSLQASYGL